GQVLSSPATLTVNTPPEITLQPQSQTVAQGGNVTFSVAVTGTAPLSYQWRLNGTDIAGATGVTLPLANVNSSQAGSYTVRVSGPGGQVLSSPATLTVNTPPEITLQPQSQTVAQGGNVTFSVAATGTGPLSYQWRFNGTDIAGGTGSTLPLAN